MISRTPNATNLVRRFIALPADQFPHIRRHAIELTTGTGHEWFGFTLDLILGNLTEREPYAAP